MIPVNAPLSTILKNISASNDCHINHLCFDSREVQEGDAFVALPSVSASERQYIQQAAEKGAAVILVDETLKLDAELRSKCVAVNQLQIQIAESVHNLLGKPTEKLNVIGVTGTNGKSSTTFYISQLLSGLQKSCAVMGTLGYGVPSSLMETGMTTLPMDRLHKVLAGMSSEYDSVAMEVSSHGLDQDRLAAVNFKGAVFTNLSHDHLDYHGTLEAYGEAKAKLFRWSGLEFAVINIDDPFGEQILQAAKISQVKNIIRYGQSGSADVNFSITSVSDAGLELVIKTETETATVSLPLYGEFNAYNAVAALCVGLALKLPFSDLLSGLERLNPVIGRMERLADHPLIIVDYAHTPDALQQVLKTSLQHCRGQLRLVVGCGGDRDQTKRPIMGEIAAQFADKVYFTSDNPRTESPQFILEQIIEPLTTNNFVVEVDRAEAIKMAVTQASSSDLILIAGKGHEDYQDINGVKQPFSDHKIALAAMEERS